MLKIFKKVDSCLESFSKWTLVFAISLMMFLSVLNIVMRWFNITFLWIDPLVRHLVFFSAFLGGSLATSKGNHIKIDLAEKIIERTKVPWLKDLIATMVISACIFGTIWLIIATKSFVKSEFEYGRDVFFGIHSGYMVSIIPVGLSLIALRFIYQLILIFNPKLKEQ